ncbi:unnamed protein product, partial [marine sediment metagenome]
FPGMQIQHAVGAGRYIYLHPGTYTLTASLDLDQAVLGSDADITIQGSGRSTIITTATDNLDIIYCHGGPGNELRDVILRDFVVRGFETGNKNDLGIYWLYVDNSKLINVWSEHNGESGFRLLTCDNNELENCHAFSNSEPGFDLRTSTWIKLINCIANSNTWHGMWLSADSDDCSIIAPTCKANDTGDTGNNHGIYITNSDRVTVESGQCDANHGHGMLVHESSRCSVTGGQFNNNDLDGIHIAGDAPNADYNIITGVVVTGNGSDGIEISEVGAGDSNKNIIT